jgi:ABC-type uncharacterized transport system involved in gliding motility auxiliary subunit
MCTARRACTLISARLEVFEALFGLLFQAVNFRLNLLSFRCEQGVASDIAVLLGLIGLLDLLLVIRPKLSQGI